MPARRAKAGGETVGGKHFKGGQFIGAEFLAMEDGPNRGATAKGMRELQDGIKKAKYANMAHAARSIRIDAGKSIKQRKSHKPAAEGDPPYQHKPGFFKRALRYFVDRQNEDAVIGFERSKVGLIAATHEHGLREDGRDYPERPIMQPALERNISRFASDWRGVDRLTLPKEKTDGQKTSGPRAKRTLRNGRQYGVNPDSEPD